MPVDRRRGKAFAVAAGSLLAVMLSAAPASADTYCAGIPSCTPNFPGIQGAFNAAAGHAGRDTVRIGPGDFSAAVYNGGGTDNPVDVIGAGPGATRVSSAFNGDTILRITNVGSSSISNVSDLTAAILRVDGIGISSENAAPGTFSQVRVERVTVTAAQGVTGATGINAWGSVRDSSVDMPPALAGAPFNTGVRVFGIETTDGLTDSTVRSDNGVVLTAFSAAGSPRILRSRITAVAVGIELRSVNGTISNTLVRTLASSDGLITPGGIQAHNVLAGSVTATITHTTIVSDGAGSFGFACAASPPNGSALATQTCNVRNSVIRGGLSWFRQGQTTSGPTVNHVANLSIAFSDAETDGLSFGSGSLSVSAIPADPLFVDPPGLDFRLRGGSPAIDSGDPAPLAVGESVTDLNGSPRIANGRRDMGAFEYQRNVPTVSAGATPATVAVGAATTLSATASDADGDPLTLTWGFDDGATATGASVAHAWATAGTHTATVTATDSAGLAASAPAAVTVTAAPAGGGNPPPPPPTPPRPTLTALAVSPTSFRAATSGTSVGTKGTRVTFRLAGAAATVRFSADRKTAGRSVKGTCVKPTSKNAKAKKCDRWVAQKGSFTRAGRLASDNRFVFTGRLNSGALSPGAYRLVASVGTGRLVSTRRASFTVAAPAKRKK